MRKRTIALALVLVLAIVLTLLPSCSPPERAQSYLAVVPKALRSGSKQAISLVLFSGQNPARGEVTATLRQNGRQVAAGRAFIDGHGELKLDVPDVEDGTYDLELKGSGFQTSTPVRIQRDYVVLLQTDKPIYKPGQTVFIRALTLDAELKPTSEQVTVEALDAKGIKVFRSEVITDDFGMASLDLPLSAEPNLGVWKITASTAKAKSELDVRVEEYVLPKYEVTASPARDWFLVNEKIQGTVSARYSFGMPVTGELEIKASRYVGKWEQYADVIKPINNGEASFEVPAAQYVAGVPAAGGSGNVMLEISVREKATGYEEKTSCLLTVAQTGAVIQLIPDTQTFKPGLPFDLLLVSQTPNNTPVDVQAQVTLTYLDGEYQKIRQDQREIKTVKGKTIIETTPPPDAVALTAEAFELTPVSSRPPAQTTLTLTAAYSPSGSFIHLQQSSEGVPKAGETVRFHVDATKKSNFYYEVISRNTVVFSGLSRAADIEFQTTPMMAPSSKLVVYQVLPNSEVAADYLPFDVEAAYPQDVSVGFSQEEARPGDNVTINIRTEGEAKVGISAVDKSVFILAENRLNLQQVFDELERLYMTPQAELHEVSIYPAIETRGAREMFDDVGVTVLTNGNVPEGKDYEFKGQSGFWEGVWNFLKGPMMGFGAAEDKAAGMIPPRAAPTTVPAPATSDTSTGLAEVQRVRQFFPETWLWDTRLIGSNGKASFNVQVPDSITTWMLEAVAISKSKGLGMADAQLRAFQPFFVSVDLPYSAIRGEQFPVNIAIYNYLDQPQTVTVALDRENWFELVDASQKTVDIGPNDIGSVSFTIRPTGIGIQSVKVTAQSARMADGVSQTIIIDPEGVPREMVENFSLSNGSSKSIDTTLPALIVDGSGRVYLTFTSSYLTQTIEGLDSLIQMPFGCGEQNMILLAPDIFITRYLTATGQLKPEIMAKAEKLMITGYQRELTYRRSDGSFSAFGENDQSGSLWLTAFVLKTFSQARDLIYVDSAVLETAKNWIASHQNADGSFDQVGFVHHQEMLGGVQGKNALTAYVAIALVEAGDAQASSKAITYLESQLDRIEDSYTMALTAYALELGDSTKRDAAYQKLMGMAKEDENGLHWGEASPLPADPQSKMAPARGLMMPLGSRSTEIEATAYATLALVRHGDALNAARASTWLVSKRNAQGGYSSTQDTVVTLQALTEQATGARADVDLTVRVKSGVSEKQLHVTKQNFDVLQVMEVAAGQPIVISTEGKGEIIGQVVKRFNVPQAEKSASPILAVTVDYDATEVEVDDLVGVTATVSFNPPEPVEAGMVVVDVAVPTGFAPVTDTIGQAVQKDPRIKRYDVAGRKVIFYIENMKPGDRISFTFKVKALYPVKAKGVTSDAYSYYQPEIRGETLGKDVTVH